MMGWGMIISVIVLMLVIDGDGVNNDDGFGVVGNGVGDEVSIGVCDGVGVGVGDGVSDGFGNKCIVIALMMAAMRPMMEEMIFTGHLLWGRCLFHGRTLIGKALY